MNDQRDDFRRFIRLKLYGENPVAADLLMKICKLS